MALPVTHEVAQRQRMKVKELRAKFADVATTKPTDGWPRIWRQQSLQMDGPRFGPGFGPGFGGPDLADGWPRICPRPEFAPNQAEFTRDLPARFSHDRSNPENCLICSQRIGLISDDGSRVRRSTGCTSDLYSPCFCWTDSCLAEKPATTSEKGRAVKQSHSRLRLALTQRATKELQQRQHDSGKHRGRKTVAWLPNNAQTIPRHSSVTLSCCSTLTSRWKRISPE